MKRRDVKRKRRPFSFILVFLLFAVCIVIAGFLSYRIYEKRYRVEVERQLSAIAELKVGELVQYRKERLGNGAILFKNASFSTLVWRFFENPEDADAQRQPQAQMHKYRTHYQYDQVLLLDTRGATLLSGRDNRPPASAVVQRIQEALRSGEVTMVDFYRHDHDQRVYLTLLVPIFDEQDDSHSLGVLFLRIDPGTYLYPFINRQPTPSRSAETLLIRRDRNNALFLNELKLQKNTALNLWIPLESKRVAVVKAALGLEGNVEGVD